MIPGDATQLVGTLKEAGAGTTPMLQGTVTAVGTNTVSVDFGLGSIPDLKYLGWYNPAVDDEVWAVANGADILVIGPLSAAGDWIAPTFQNGWVNYGGAYAVAGYAIEPYRTVRLKGMVASGTTGTVFNVGLENAPSERHVYNQMSVSGQARVDVLSNGNVDVFAYYNGGSNSWVSLSGITWRIA